MTLKIDAKFTEKLICYFKNDKNLENFGLSTRNSKSTLIGSFCAKYITFDPKSTEELSFVTTKIDAKFEEKLSYGLENGMKFVANFH